MGDKSPVERHQGGAGFFHAYPPTYRVRNTELVVGGAQAVPEHSWADGALLGTKASWKHYRPGSQVSRASLMVRNPRSKGPHRLRRILGMRLGLAGELQKPGVAMLGSGQAGLRVKELLYL